MITFIKINGISVFYAFILFVEVELLINEYRLERITGITNINYVIPIAMLTIFVLSTIFAYYQTRSLFDNRKIKYFSTVVWLPYFLFFIKLFSDYYPITSPEEHPLPAIGLVIILMVILYFFYILLINFLSGFILRLK